jgi:phosphoribosylanthranilate isomerase
LSGGLNAQTLLEPVRRIRPWAVDVSSGVESEPGIKLAPRIAEFVAAVKKADA